LASNYFYNEEMEDALARHERKEAIVVPVILKYCPWNITELSQLQALPKDAKPITAWSDESEAYNSIFEGIYQNVQTIESRKKAEQQAIKLAEQKRKQEETRKFRELKEQKQRVKEIQEKREFEKAKEEKRQQELQLQNEREKIQQEERKRREVEHQKQAEGNRKAHIASILLQARRAYARHDYTKTKQYTKAILSLDSTHSEAQWIERDIKNKRIKNIGGLLKIGSIIPISFIVIYIVFLINSSKTQDKPITTIVGKSTETSSIDSLPEPIQRLMNDMVFVEGGTFEMGCTQEQGGFCSNEYKHVVKLGSFKIGKYEVTQDQWQTVMDNNPSGFENCGSRCPVERLIWKDTQEFIQKLNYMTNKTFRLPTEAEWEYAARGGKQSKGYRFAGSDDISSVAWYSGNSNSKTHIVGTKNPNELDLYDMSGNVEEWCNDWYDKDYYLKSPHNDPQGPTSPTIARVMRGGSLRGNNSCRIANRSLGADVLNSNHGFRLAQTLE